MDELNPLTEEIIKLIEHSPLHPIERILMFDTYVSIMGIHVLPDKLRRPERPLLKGAP